MSLQETTTKESYPILGFFIWISVEILVSLCCFGFIVAAVVVGIKLSRRNQNVVVVKTSPAPAVNHKAASKKSKKTPKTGGKSAMNSEPSKTEEEDPGVGA